RIGVKALVYFEVVSTFALVIGLLVGNLVRPGAGFGGAMANAQAVANYAKQAEGQKSVDFFLHIIPDTVVGAFANGEILQVLLFSILFGFALMGLGERGHTLRSFIDDAAHGVFGVIAIVMKAAPIGAFGAMAFTIGKFGTGAILNLIGLIATFYVTAALFVFVVPGMAIVLGIDKFMSECRALTNLCGNGVACVVVSWWEGELNQEKLHANLNKEIDPSDVETALTTG